MKIDQLVSKITEIYGFLATDEQETLTELIQQVKSEWCKEQRENCWDELKKVDYWFSHEKGIQKIIETAPEP
jgi:hypothetical protein